MSAHLILSGSVSAQSRCWGLCSFVNGQAGCELINSLAEMGQDTGSSGPSTRSLSVSKYLWHTRSTGATQYALTV